MWNLSHASQFVQDLLVVLHLSGRFQEICLPSVDISIYVFLALLEVSPARQYLPHKSSLSGVKIFKLNDFTAGLCGYL